MTEAAAVFTDGDGELAVVGPLLDVPTPELAVLADAERQLYVELADKVVHGLFAAGLDMHATIGRCDDTELRARMVAHVEAIDVVINDMRSGIVELRSDASAK